MQIFYDNQNKRLIYIENKTSSTFWDKHWSNQEGPLSLDTKTPRFDLVTTQTKKYLASGSKILEGGCGLGQNVQKLQKAGFKVTGVDYAKATIRKLNELFPALNIEYGDINNLKYPDNNFDGYWSVGVIEHFFDGYQPALQEMQRVIRKDGCLFLTFPHMSFLRRIKAKLNKYPLWDKKRNSAEFYQFALDENKVIEDLRSHDLKLIKKKKFDGIKGLRTKALSVAALCKRSMTLRQFLQRLPRNLYLSG